MLKLLAKVRRLLTRKRVWYSIKHHRHGWVANIVDGTPFYSVRFAAALWYQETDEARVALAACKADIRDYTPYRITVHLGIGEYVSEPWMW